jgi:hypothetical protein
MAESSKSALTLLLILSAIDMLCASLVCSIVLFVVLVGADSADGSTENSKFLEAPTIVELIAAGEGDAFPRLYTGRQTEASSLSPVLEVDEWHKLLFPQTDLKILRERTLIISSDTVEISASISPSLPLNLELQFTLGDGRSLKVFSRCSATPSGTEIRIQLRPKLLLTRTCGSNAIASVTPPKGLNLQLGISPPSSITHPLGVIGRPPENIIAGDTQNFFATSADQSAIDKDVSVIGVLN